jgi:hypothetical protein
VDATAYITVPALTIDMTHLQIHESRVLVWAQGQVVNKPAGVLRVQQVEDGVLFEVSSGWYRFSTDAAM